MLLDWREKNSDLVLDHPVLQVRRARRRRQDGLEHEFVVLSSPDWVNVVPVTPQGEVVLIRQYRQGSREVALEIPGGLIDPGEDPARAGARELAEETGYVSPGLVPLGWVNPNPALFDNTCHTFLAPDAVRAAEPRPDDCEQIEVVTVPAADLPALVRGGQITHSLVVAAIAFYWLWKGGGAPGTGA